MNHTLDRLREKQLPRNSLYDFLTPGVLHVFCYIGLFLGLFSTHWQEAIAGYIPDVGERFEHTFDVDGETYTIASGSTAYIQRIYCVDATITATTVGTISDGSGQAYTFPISESGGNVQSLEMVTTSTLTYSVGHSSTCIVSGYMIPSEKWGRFQDLQNGGHVSFWKDIGDDRTTAGFGWIITRLLLFLLVLYVSYKGFVWGSTVSGGKPGV